MHLVHHDMPCDRKSCLFCFLYNPYIPFLNCKFVHLLVSCPFLLLLVMKGTKVLTLGAGLRSLAPQHGGYKDVDADDIYTRPLAIRMRYMCIYACAVLLIGGQAGPFYRFTDSWSLTSLLRVGHRVATLLDSTRESILALRYNFWHLQGTQSWSR